MQCLPDTLYLYIQLSIIVERTCRDTRHSHLSLPDVLLCVTDNALYMKHPPMHAWWYLWVCAPYYNHEKLKIDLHPIYIHYHLLYSQNHDYTPTFLWNNLMLIVYVNWIGLPLLTATTITLLITFTVCSTKGTYYLIIILFSFYLIINLMHYLFSWLYQL